jgi:polysaccharide export outer membrane protein
MLRSLRSLLTLACLLVLSAGAASTHAAGPVNAEYRLLPGDRLEVAVWKEADLQKVVIVTPDGNLSFPLIGIVSAAGKTLVEVKQEIERRLATYMPDPVVTVTVTALAGRVYVIGQVARPGALETNPRINVLQALALAGGLTPFAKGDDIIVLRAVASGDQRVLQFKFGQVSQGRNLEQNTPLENGDVIVVP